MEFQAPKDWIIHVGDESRLGLRVKVFGEKDRQLGLVQWVNLITLEYEQKLLEPHDENNPPKEWFNEVGCCTVPFQTNPDGSIKTRRGIATRVEITKRT